jgi:hypothetical protein
MSMIHLLILAVHLLATIAKLVRPGGVRVVVAESLLIKHQLLISSRARRRAPNLNSFDRFVLGLGSLFVPASRIPKLAVILKPSPYFSHYLRMIGLFCEEAFCFFAGALCRRVRRRESCWDFFGLRSSEEEELVSVGLVMMPLWVTRRGVACQTGEARAFAAAASRVAARPHASAAGQPDAIATLMRRTLTRTRAPILSSLRRMVPQVALANCV